MTRPIVWAVGAFAALAITATLAGERLAGLAGRRGPEPAVRAVASTDRAAPIFDPVVTVSADLRGHYIVRPSIEGVSVAMMVDTGASSIALRHEDALALGLRPSRSEFTGRAGTANGTIEFAPVRIREIRLNGILVRDVDAAVMPPGRLGMSLLGMSFLRQLRGFDIAGGRLTLRG